MDLTFTRAIGAAADRPQWRCLGLRLRPMTVGHLFLLLELENAYPDRMEEADPADLITAVLVCSRPVHKARRMLKSPWADLGVRIWGRLCRHKNATEEVRKFCEYLREQLGVPQQETMGKPEARRVPLAWRLQAMLMAELNLTREQTLAAEVPWALTMWATEADRRGVARVADDRLIWFREWVREQEALRQSGTLGARPSEEGGNPS